MDPFCGEQDDGADLGAGLSDADADLEDVSEAGEEEEEEEEEDGGEEEDEEEAFAGNEDDGDREEARVIELGDADVDADVDAEPEDEDDDIELGLGLGAGGRSIKGTGATERRLGKLPKPKMHAKFVGELLVEEVEIAMGLRCSR